MKSTSSAVTYLIFEFSFQHVLFTCIRHYVCIVYCMKMHNYFLLNIKHGASRGPWGGTAEGEGEGPL